MHATHQPMAVRIAAASALLPYTHPAPRSVIPPLSYEPWSDICSPWPREEDPTGNHSENLVSLNKTLTRDDEAVPPQNLETTPYPLPLVDYSIPPTPAELQQIKAAVHALQPNFDPSQPIPLYLCACGHWLTFPCDCATRTRH